MKLSSILVNMKCTFLLCPIEFFHFSGVKWYHLSMIIKKSISMAQIDIWLKNLKYRIISQLQQNSFVWNFVNFASPYTKETF